MSSPKRDPSPPAAVHSRQLAGPRIRSWFWVLVIGVLGLVIAHNPGAPPPSSARAQALSEWGAGVNSQLPGSGPSADLPGRPGGWRTRIASEERGPRGGIGGTGAPAYGANGNGGGEGGGDASGDGNGIGGTGNYAETDTGIGGTGVIGTITGFGSILVNGYEIDYDPDAEVAYKTGTLSAARLRIGQVVEVEAEGDGAKGDRLTARAIKLRLEVAGPIEQVDAVRSHVVILGQRVDLNEAILARDDDQVELTIDDLAIGQWAEVSGWRRDDGTIAATRLDISSSAGDGLALVRGPLEGAEGDRLLVVAGTAVTMPPTLAPSDLTPGNEVVVYGVAQGGRLRARQLERLPTRPFAGRVRWLSLEGYVGRARFRQARRAALLIGRFRIGGGRLARSLRPGERVILNGPYDPRLGLRPYRLRRPIIRQLRARARRHRLRRQKPRGRRRPGYRKRQLRRLHQRPRAIRPRAKRPHPLQRRRDLRRHRRFWRR